MPVCPASGQTGTGIKKIPMPEQECSGTGLRFLTPECRCPAMRVSLYCDTITMRGAGLLLGKMTTPTVIRKDFWPGVWSQVCRECPPWGPGRRRPPAPHLPTPRLANNNIFDTCYTVSMHNRYKRSTILFLSAPSSNIRGYCTGVWCKISVFCSFSLCLENTLLFIFSCIYLCWGRFWVWPVFSWVTGIQAYFMSALPLSVLRISWLFNSDPRRKKIKEII